MTASIDFERERPFAVDEHRHEDAANAIVFVWHRGRAPGAGDFIIVWPRRSREHFTIDWMRADLCRIDLDCLDRSIFRIFVSLEERNHYAVADIAPIGIMPDEPTAPKMHFRLPKQATCALETKHDRNSALGCDLPNHFLHIAIFLVR